MARRTSLLITRMKQTFPDLRKHFVNNGHIWLSMAEIPCVIALYSLYSRGHIRKGLFRFRLFVCILLCGSAPANGAFLRFFMVESKLVRIIDPDPDQP